jgi:hypothetical protein
MIQKLESLLVDCSYSKDQTLQTSLRDVLTELRHASVDLRLDFNMADEEAEQKFKEEKRVAYEQFRKSKLPWLMESW